MNQLLSSKDKALVVTALLSSAVIGVAGAKGAEASAPDLALDTNSFPPAARAELSKPDSTVYLHEGPSPWRQIATVGLSIVAGFAATSAGIGALSRGNNFCERTRERLQGLNTFSANQPELESWIKDLDKAEKAPFAKRYALCQDALFAARGRPGADGIDHWDLDAMPIGAKLLGVGASSFLLAGAFASGVVSSPLWLAVIPVSYFVVKPIVERVFRGREEQAGL